MEVAGILLAGLVASVAVLLALTPIVDRHRRITLRRALADVCCLFEAAEIEYWCDFGTLLGYHREDDIISGDKDADLAALVSEHPRITALDDRFRALGYRLTTRGGRGRKLLRIHDGRTWYHVDVYPYVPDGEMLRSLLVSPAEDVPLNLVAERRRVPFLGTTLLVPADVPALLRYRYGADFMRPRRGDKGRTRPYSRLRSLLEDLQDTCLGIRSLALAGWWRLAAALRESCSWRGTAARREASSGRRARRASEGIDGIPRDRAD